MGTERRNTPEPIVNVFDRHGSAGLTGLALKTGDRRSVYYQKHIDVSGFSGLWIPSGNAYVDGCSFVPHQVSGHQLKDDAVQVTGGPCMSCIPSRRRAIRCGFSTAIAPASRSIAVSDKSAAATRLPNKVLGAPGSHQPLGGR
ncbi:hypothetical protein CEJ86_33180 [Sinorhizobium meliloti]|uniref:Uncharacterized protein n=1 Tax=Rhizobium meliloti TaxID=382 RepID=A0A2J0YSP9_RHIML|nr:hypothetical protein CEJ86_33180 [Sinorhizobium meliloti]